MIFNAGQRICIGRQAAIVEATAFIARTVAKFRVEAPAGESEVWKARAGESGMDRRQRIYKVRLEAKRGVRWVS
jgi:cytochrome P450